MMGPAPDLVQWDGDVVAGSVYQVFDAAYPPMFAPPGTAGVLGYVGRPGFTPHVWTPDEWRRFEHLRQYPCWLPDRRLAPDADAWDAVNTVTKLGWARFDEPDTRAIVLDGEADQFRAWYTVWAATVQQAGFHPVDYGSLSTVFGNAAYDVWAANWDGIPALIPGQVIHGDQFRAGVPWHGTMLDLSVIDGDMLARGGVGPRHG